MTPLSHPSAFLPSMKRSLHLWLYVSDKYVDPPDHDAWLSKNDHKLRPVANEIGKNDQNNIIIGVMFAASSLRVVILVLVLLHRRQRPDSSIVMGRPQGASKRCLVCWSQVLRASVLEKRSSDKTGHRLWIRKSCRRTPETTIRCINNLVLVYPEQINPTLSRDVSISVIKLPLATTREVWDTYGTYARFL